MCIQLPCHNFNSLSQRLHVDLRRAGHEVTVELDIHDDFTREAVALFSPDLVIAPFLKRPIPADVWRGTLWLIVHPGMDAGPVWAWAEFPMRPARKSSLYRHEVTQAAVACVFEAIEPPAVSASGNPVAGDGRSTAPPHGRPWRACRERPMSAPAGPGTPLAQ
ncbi:hypothetical protein [Mesorhizobium shangrilense]|uniref:LysR substrate-binding domain-containing protein n=1 Tax=Mesorhizobium shangrilense TaxID=460060 RepID=A0ABV2DR02_9HYPH